MGSRRGAIGIAAVVFAFALLPFCVSPYGLRILDLSVIAAFGVIGLCFAFGYTGLLDLGQAAFVGLGAYGSAVLAVRAGMGFWLSAPVAIAGSTAFAILIGWPLLRLRGHYLALATVGLNVALEIIARNWEAVTGGDNGLAGIPGIAIGGFSINSDFRFFYVGVVLLCVLTLAGYALKHSRFGRAMIAVRDDELACGSSGVSVRHVKLLAFAVAAFCGAMSGALYAHYTHYVAPNDFDLVRSITLLVMLIVGGEASLLGAVAGALIITFAPELLRFAGEAYLVIFGVAVLIVLILMPDGLVGAMSRLRRRQVGYHG